MKMMSEILFCTLLAVALSLSNAKATVRIEPEVRELHVAEGYTLTMMCIVEGHPSNNDVVLWSVPYLNEKEFPKMQKMNSDGTYTTAIELTIEEFKRDQKGSYECMLLPNDGSSKEQAEILVKLVEAVTVRFEPEVGELLIAEGYTLKIRCIVEGHSSPNADILWTVPYHNFHIKPMNSKKEFQRMEKTNSDGTYTTTTELTIEKFREDQSGCYKCIHVFFPKDGSSYGVTKILVKLVAENKTQPGDDTTMLFCSPPLGQDAKMVGWFKGDKPIEKGEKYTLYENGSLGIMDLDRDDAGLYKLRFELNTGKTYDCVIEYRAARAAIPTSSSGVAQISLSLFLFKVTSVVSMVSTLGNPLFVWMKIIFL